MTDLGAYLQSAISRTWAWGRWDCCRFAAEWCIRRGRGDPMDFLRPLYTSEFAALRTIREGGGLVALWSRGMADIDAPEVENAALGDVGIVNEFTDHGDEQVCAIYTGKRWAMLGIHGLVCVPAEPIKVWRP
jgi:hypothetical protein